MFSTESVRIFVRLSPLAVIPLFLSCSIFCSRIEPPISIEGIWQERFLIEQEKSVLLEQFWNQNTLHTVAVTATLTLKAGLFTSEIDRSVTLQPDYSAPSPIEGHYRIRGDTIRLIAKDDALEPENYVFSLTREALSLEYLPVIIDTLANGALAEWVGGIPWHYARFKDGGTFRRVE
jgi:hypothetical protein